MNVSLHWLKDYIEIDIPVPELAERLTMFGLEVESTRNLGDRYLNHVVGKVLEVRNHPSADKLSLCKVDIGGAVLQIVCGAPNVAPGQRVVIAKPGAVVAHNQHDPDGRSFVLTQATIRGELSQAMICSAYELDLGADKEGILVLPNHSSVGMPLSVYLGLDDTVIEIGVTANRPDALSHVGVAREIGAMLSKRLKLPRVRTKEEGRRTEAYASVRIQDVDKCPRYTARIVFDVNVGDAPRWIRDRLVAVGMRPINNIVDITNYVLMEIGHPLHAFDYDKIKGHSVTIRSSRDGETLETLDGKTRTFRESDLLICDAERPLAIAGIMGGAESEITQSTRNILIESAFFDPRSVRRTSKLLGITTDASQRFERGADPNITDWAVDRAASLIQRECGGTILKGRIDVYPKKIVPRRVNLRMKRMNQILGTTISSRQASGLLRKLWINPLPSKSRMRSLSEITYEVPTGRPDLAGEIDLIEEVARVYGYDRIDTTSRSLLHYSDEPPEPASAGFLRDWLVASGYHEIVTNSLQEESAAALPSENYVKIANPISKEMAALRTSLILSALTVIRHNIFHGRRDFRIFEFGRAYFRDESAQADGSIRGYREEARLLLAYTGLTHPRSWGTKPRQSDIILVKGELETLFQKIFLDKFKFIPYSNTKALTDTGLAIEINGRDAGIAGRISGDLLKKFELEQDVFVAELRIDPLVSSLVQQRRYRELPKYPPAMRDLAVTVDEGLPVGKILDEINAAGEPLLSQVELFDVYAGEQIGQGKKSCAFALEFMAEDHTLTQQEVERIMKQIIDRVSLRLHATLRS